MYTTSVVLSLVLGALAAPQFGGSPSASASAPAASGGIGGGNFNFGPVAGTRYNATFDDLTPVAGAAAAQEVGPYDGLDYEGIDLVTLGVDGEVVLGVYANTGSNVGAYGATTGLLDGAPTLSAIYEGGVYSSFDFKQFYFGCVVGTVEAIASAPTSCDITVSAYRYGVYTASKTFSFDVGLMAVTAPLVRATLGKEFEDITSVVFSTEYTDLMAAGATVIDSLVYTAYKPTEGGRWQNGAWNKQAGF